MPIHARRERDDEHVVHTELPGEIGPGGHRAEPRGKLLGRENRHRMGIERHEDRGDSELPGPPGGRSDESAVSPVNSVEHTDGDHRALEVCGYLLQSVPNVHRYSVRDRLNCPHD